jgi:oxidase EvaA
MGWAMGVDPVEDWVLERRSLDPLIFREIPLEECEPWQPVGEKIQRPDSRYFSGRFEADRVWIEQPEVGLLGLLFAHSEAGLSVLLQLKDEPGSVGVTQLGPTVQATASNLEKVHGGQEQPYVDFFERRGRAKALSEARLSEQGFRFWKKVNRNASAVARAMVEETLNHRWFSIPELLAVNHVPFLLNTDLRSVISTIDYKILLSGPSKNSVVRKPIVQKIRESFFAQSSGATCLYAVLRDMRLRTFEESALTEEIGSGSQARGNSTFRYFRVSAKFREIDSWNQPLLVSDSRTAHFLLVSEGASGLQVLLRIVQEPGLIERLEFGPTAQAEQDRYGGYRYRSSAHKIIEDHAEEVVSVEQSDEGGRFFQEIGRYSIFWLPRASEGRRAIDDVVSHSESLFWASLPDLNRLCGFSGATTNELRTLVSLLIT